MNTLSNDSLHLCEDSYGTDALENICIFRVLSSPEYEGVRGILERCGDGKTLLAQRCARRFFGKGESILNSFGSVVL